MSQPSDNSPTFSVVIPAYMSDRYLGEAIQSVLDQTFSDFEVIVVNDASPDNTTAVVADFKDPRIKYIVHPENRGLPATRNTAIRASSGKYIALLDADDVFHPDKLQAHYEFLEKNPNIGVTYNSRFDLGDSTQLIRRIWIAPRQITLSDFVLGYPYAPSDIVFRREWLFNIGLFDENNSFHGEDLNTNCRLALAGCKFGYVERVLNYRRNQPARVRKHLDESLNSVFRNLELVFNDPRCPAETVALRGRVYGINYMVWAYWAFAQEETELGVNYLRKAVQRDPAILKGHGYSLLYFLVWSCATDERGDLSEAMDNIFKQIPDDFSYIRSRFDWALGRALLIRGFEDVMWGRLEQGRDLFEQAAQHHAAADDAYIGLIVHQLSGYEIEYGVDAVLALVKKLKPYLNTISKRCGDELEASYLVNGAFRKYQNGKFNDVLGSVLRAWLRDPSYLMNRGVVSIFFRSMIRAAR